MTTLGERNKTINELQSGFQKYKSGSQSEIANLRRENQEMHAALDERGERLNDLQREFKQYKGSSEEELASLRKTMQKVQDLQRELVESRKDYESQEMKHTESSKAFANKVQSLIEELRQQNESHRSALDTIQARHKSELEGLSSEYERAREASHQNHLDELRDHERELRLQFEKREQDLTAKIGDMGTRYEAISARARRDNDELIALRTDVHDKNSKIGELKLRLDEANKRENQMRSDINKMISEGEERERKLRDARNCNDSLREELKVNYHVKSSLQ